MSGLRRPVTVTRRTPGVYDSNGRWQEGTTSQLTILASVQPAKVEDVSSMMKELPEGRQSGGVVKIYSAEPLQRAEDGTEPIQNADQIAWQGRTYEVVLCMPYQSGLLSHYKSLALEVRP